MLLAKPVAFANLLERPAPQRVAVQHVGEELAQVLIRPIRYRNLIGVGTDTIEYLMDVTLEGQLARRHEKQGDSLRQTN